MNDLQENIVLTVSQWLSTGFVVLLAILLVWAAVMYIQDRYQTRHTIRRNYPVIGRFRYLFEHLGEFFRQYFFSMDREELPFNRAQRSWVYRAAKNLDNTQAFGSSKDNSRHGHILFSNAAYPYLDSDPVGEHQIRFGPYCRNPYTTSSLFNISGMSFGAISRPALEALSHGAAEAGCWLNTGEGGLSRYHLESNCDLVFQIGTANYGVRDKQGQLDEEKLKSIATHSSVRMFEIKLSQGAKPGKGGILPAVKVTPEIALIRGIPAGESSISPNRHPDIHDNESLLATVNRVRKITGKPTGIKIVIGDSRWLDGLFTLINERGTESAPDFITLDSGNGGTGAAPMTLIDDMGSNLHEALPILVNKLRDYGLHPRIRVIASGKLINPIEVAWALCTGADCVTTARGFMFSIGCIQALQCNRNTCPTGITTHDPSLQRGLVPSNKAKRVTHYHRNMLKELVVIAHSCGVAHPSQLRREHARFVIDRTRSIPLDIFYREAGMNREQTSTPVNKDVSSL